MLVLLYSNNCTYHYVSTTPTKMVKVEQIMAEKIDDLIKRAKKHGKGAGRIQLGHYRAATVNERWHYGLTLIAAALSAVVGTSIFADLPQKNRIVLSIASILAAVSSALQGGSKFAEKAKEHRDAGADYGSLRRKIDVLCLCLEAGDVTREKALDELEEINNTLTSLAHQSPVLSERAYHAAVKIFDKDHPQYNDSSNVVLVLANPATDT